MDEEHYELIASQTEGHKCMIPLFSDTSSLLPSKAFSMQFNLIKKVNTNVENQESEENEEQKKFSELNESLQKYASSEKLPELDLVVRYFPPGSDENWLKKAYSKSSSSKSSKNSQTNSNGDNSGDRNTPSQNISPKKSSKKKKKNKKNN